MSKRIQAIDSFRGVMLFLMTLTHLINLNFHTLDFLRPYVYGPFGYFTDPEGFFFLSGFVAALVFGKSLLEGDVLRFREKILSRVKQLYLFEMALLGGLTLALVLSPAYVQSYLSFNVDPTYLTLERRLFFAEHPLEAFSLGSVFLFQPWFLDLLPLYVYFTLLTPLVLKQLLKGHYKRVIALSFGVWLLNFSTPENMIMGALRQFHPQVLMNFFNLMAWQLLYVMGLVFGFLKLTKKLPKLSRPLQTLAVVLASLFFFMKHWGCSFPWGTDLHNLGPLRLLSFGAAACTAWTFHHYLTLGIFVLLGRSALQVFAYHVVLAYFLIYFRSEIDGLLLVPKLVLFVLCSLSIWIPAYLTEVFKKRENIHKIAV